MLWQFVQVKPPGRDAQRGSRRGLRPCAARGSRRGRSPRGIDPEAGESPRRGQENRVPALQGAVNRADRGALGLGGDAADRLGNRREDIEAREAGGAGRCLHHTPRFERKPEIEAAVPGRRDQTLCFRPEQAFARRVRRDRARSPRQCVARCSAAASRRNIIEPTGLVLDLDWSGVGGMRPYRVPPHGFGREE